MAPCTSVRFAIVDVFTDTVLAGSPVAVVSDAEGLDDRVLSLIARELRQPEAIFILPARRAGADWRLRSFTPAGKEMTGPGQNSLGAWWWLASSKRVMLEDAGTRLHQEVGECIVTVVIESEGGCPTTVGIHQTPPRFGLIVRDRLPLARALGIPSVAFGPREPRPQVVSTGTPHLLVPVAASAIGAVRPDPETLHRILLATGARGCYVFALTPDCRTAATARSFNFNADARFSEEPATGSAAGPLACYLRQHGLLHDDGPVRIAQGLETGRPCELEIELRGVDVVLRGRAVTAAVGTFHLPVARTRASSRERAVRQPCGPVPPAQ